MTSHPPRILMYSHDGMGIGHVRRNLLLGSSIVHAAPGSSVLLVAGVCEAGAFHMPQGIDCLTVPSLCKDGGGLYRARRLSLSRERTIHIRSRSIRAATEAFEPDAVIVDKVPRGVAGELEDTLSFLRKKSLHTKIILGLRDILDEPDAVRHDWARDRNEAAIEEFYDAVWVYGDRAVYDAAKEYGWSPATVSKICYTGYLERATSTNQRTTTVADDLDIRAALGLPAGRRIMLCMVGGGEDGAPLAQAFAAAAMPSDSMGVVLAGPMMPAAERRILSEIAANNSSDIKIMDFLPEPAPLIHIADRAVAMGGYNCVGDLLCAGLPSLIVPRVHPRQEQWIRATRLTELGYIEMLRPHLLEPHAITTWLAKPASIPRNHALKNVDFSGLSRVPGLLARLLEGPGNHGGSSAISVQTHPVQLARSPAATPVIA